jgi:hypothetical protein
MVCNNSSSSSRHPLWWSLPDPVMTRPNYAAQPGQAPVFKMEGLHAVADV